jgi:hypothetical protein
MYKPKLTIEQALAEIEPVRHLSEWDLGQDHQFVKDNQTTRELELRAFQEEWWVRTKSIGKHGVAFKSVAPGPVEFPEEIEREYLQAKARLKEWFFLSEEGVYRPYEKFLYDTGVPEFSRDMYNLNRRVTTMQILELLKNAIWHGSDWCRKGPVILRTAIGYKNSILAVIDQPENFPLEDVMEKAKQRAAFLAAHGRSEETPAKERPSGSGLMNAFLEYTPRVNFHPLANGAWRTLFLATPIDALRLKARMGSDFDG